jgi:hypothetical protein
LPEAPNLVAVLHYVRGVVLKYILDQAMQSEQVFDLSSDPAETRNVLADTSPQELTEMRRRAHALLRDR